jgi:hypothetical protein
MWERISNIKVCIDSSFCAELYRIPFEPDSRPVLSRTHCRSLLFSFCSYMYDIAIKLK